MHISFRILPTVTEFNNKKIFFILDEFCKRNDKAHLSRRCIGEHILQVETFFRSRIKINVSVFVDIHGGKVSHKLFKVFHFLGKFSR